jgi:uncharacterized membrane protein required for colicin V production
MIPRAPARGAVVAAAELETVGTILDIVSLAVVAGFGYVGSTLGFVRSVIRLIAVCGALLVALLLLSPVGWALRTLGTSRDFGNLVAILAIGAGSYLAVAAVINYYSGWVPHERLYRSDRALGTIPAVLLGAAWVTVMMGLLVLQPSDNAIARGAISSRTGSALVDGAPGVLRWMLRTFPHYTQALPKGSAGAITGVRAGIPLRTGSQRNDPKDAGDLLANINKLRADKDGPGHDLVWNQDVASVALRHSHAMFDDRLVGAVTADGVNIDSQVKSALGSNISLYSHFAHLVVWAHDESTAFAALVGDPRLRSRLADPALGEVGIGVVDGGWFNGRMYTVALIGRAATAITGVGSAPAGSANPPLAAGASGTQTGTVPAGTAPAAAGTMPAPPPANTNAAQPLGSG